MHRDTLLGRAHGSMPRHAGTIAFVLLLAAIVFCILAIPIGPDLAAARKACDRAVDMLLTSQDPVELQRSGILIRALDCSVSRRLPREP